MSDPKSHRMTLDRTPLSWDTLDAAYGSPLHVDIAASSWERVRASRASINGLIEQGQTIYGVNTGFGKLCNKKISSDQLSQLQENLLVSHAVGTGAAVPPEIVRFMLLFKINALLAGASGISPACVECLAEMLNADVLPHIPSRGSLGASGDLAPLAHLVLPLIGRGEVLYDGKLVPAKMAFEKKNIKPVRMEPKDGLALINGTQLMLAYAAALTIRARRLAKHADIAASMSLEAFRGSIKPFDERLMALRPHPGAREVADNVRRLLGESEILPSHANCDKVQDPYSIRCVPQVHGACRDALRHAASVIEIELQSVTDNPVLIDGEVISGGLFHGEPLALVLDYLAMALTEWASISERRTYLLLSGADGLPPLLIKDGGINSGLMIVHYTAAALVNECKVLSTPASVDTITTSLGQEDHVSMGATSALKCWQIMEHVETVLAIEMLCAAQGLDYRLPLRAGMGPRLAHEEIRRQIAHAEADRQFGLDIASALAILRGQAVTTSVQKRVGALH
jgi:histidine ammonia-lyase